VLRHRQGPPTTARVANPSAATPRVSTSRPIAARLAAALLGVTLLAGACANTHATTPIQFPPNAAPSRILDAKGRLITTIAEENRQSVSIRDIPVIMQQAIVAAEDSRFWSHRGVDPRGILRAAKANADAKAIAEGGSTITQQYVKNALLDNKRTFGRKIEEATTALALERAYSKEVILEQYLNTIYFGGGAYGVEAAAQTFFGVHAAQLSLPQAATLAGLVNAPGLFDPRANPVNAQTRRNLVLERMEKQGYITAEQRLAAASAPLGVADAPPAQETQHYPAPHFVEEVKHWLLTESDALGDNQAERYNNLLRGGLTITTTIDLDLQAKAEASIADVLPGQGQDPKTPDAALTSIEPETGFVRAMVGGYDFWGTHSYAKTNLSVGAGRSTGSAFKPVVLATALTNGVSLDKVFPAPDAATFNLPGGGTWSVKGGEIGSGTMTQCTIVSSNTCFANIILDPAVGPQRAVEMAQKLGITHTQLQANYAAVLGTNNVTVQDMASVFATFANGGVHVPAVYVTKVERADGTVLYDQSHTQTKVLEPEVARRINDILPQVITDPSGTGNKANINRPAGGKTGSAEANTDAWFCGYTPQLATAVWVGFAEPRAGRDGVRRLVSMSGSNTRITVFGGTYPAQIWAKYMSSALEGVPATPLYDPAPPPTTTTAPPGDPAVLAPVTTLKKATVPDVLNKTGEQARATLEKAGFAVKRKEVDAGPDAAPGRVVAQSPPSGQAAEGGSTVWVEVTAGSPASRTPVPDLRGYGTGQATDTLTSQGFTVTNEVTAPPAGTLRPDGKAYEGGQVWRTTPAAGELAADGAVRLSSAPQAPAPSTSVPTPTPAPAPTSPPKPKD